VPGIYLDYLRRGWSPRLPLVWEHNLQDVRSLAALFARLNRVLGGEEQPGRADLASLGSWLLNAGKAERGLELLSRSFAEGDERAGRALGLHLKRAGRWDEAAEVWRRMAAEGRSLFAAVELAKHAEHRLRDPREALDWVRRVLDWGLPLEARFRRELSVRRARLERIAARRAARQAQAPK
jgi:pentatricopeptide repeat protein